MWRADLKAILDKLGDVVKAGKVRAIGLSNDTAWGTMKLIDMAERHGLPRVASIQNEYNLLYRAYDLDLAEAVAPRGRRACSPIRRSPPAC